MKVYMVIKIGAQFDRFGVFSSLQKAKEQVNKYADVEWTDLAHESYGYHNYPVAKTGGYMVYAIMEYEVDR